LGKPSKQANNIYITVAPKPTNESRAHYAELARGARTGHGTV